MLTSNHNSVSGEFDPTSFQFEKKFQKLITQEWRVKKKPSKKLKKKNFFLLVELLFQL